MTHVISTQVLQYFWEYLKYLNLGFSDANLKFWVKLILRFKIEAVDFSVNNNKVLRLTD